VSTTASTILTVTMWTGVIVTWIACYHRVGFPELRRRHGVDWREFLTQNWWWFLLAAAKTFLWPITLAAWLMSGRSPSRWKAVVELNGRPARAIVRCGIDQTDGREIRNL
jgi:hypothetical protein